MGKVREERLLVGTVAKMELIFGRQIRAGVVFNLRAKRVKVGQGFQIGHVHGLLHPHWIAKTDSKYIPG